jgi:hypothetical protein
LKRFGDLLHSKKLSLISNYLQEDYNLSPNEVVISSITTFIMLFIPFFAIFFLINPFLAILISIIIGYVGAYTIFNYPIANYNRIQHSLLQYSDLAFQDLILILNTTNSIFDAIQFLSGAQYPILSKIFKNILFQINNFGKSPELLIQQFINKLPNGNLKERLINLMATRFHPNKILEQLELLSGEKKFEYEVATQQLESKLIIIVGICIFFPIITALFISFLGSSSNFLSFFMIPIYIFLSYQFKTRIIKGHFELFGEFSPLDKDELGTNSDLIEFLHFLTYLGNELKRGVPQEIALLNACQAYNGLLKYSIEKSVQELYNNSIKDSWNQLKKTFKSPQIHFLIDLVDRMLEKSSYETGKRILSIIQQMKANQELIRERESIIKAQQFKIKFLTCIMAAILGLIAGLTPLLFQISSIFHNFEIQQTVSFWRSLPLNLAIFIMVIYSAYILPNLVKIHRPWRYSFWTGLIFCFFWYLTSYFV